MRWFVSSVFTAVALACGVPEDASAQQEAASPEPLQEDFLTWEFGLFIHFNVATFNERQWATGTEDPASFAPTKLDCNQWIDAAVAAGMKYAVLTVKHTGGWCLWDSKHTASHDTTAFVNYKNGKGDIVREFVDACRKRGVKVGLYYCLPGDFAQRHLPKGEEDKLHGLPPEARGRYTQFIKNQLSELLTDYGPIDLMWFDQYENEYTGKDWRGIKAHVKSLQPRCVVIANNSEDYEDTDLHSYEYGWRKAKGMQTLPKPGNVNPSEVCDNIGNGWFWTSEARAENMDSAAEVVRMLEVCNSRRANYLLNVAPDRSGLIPDWGVARLREIGQLRSAAKVQQGEDQTVAQALSPEAVVAGFEQRVEAVFRAEAGKPLVADKISKGRASSRNYSKSIMAFAARCFYLNEQIDEANAALAENAQYYLDHPKDIYNADTFHWHADALLRLLDMYGTNGTAKPGLIKPQTEALALEPVWMHVKKLSTLKKADPSKVWHVYESENHHTQSFAAYWHFSKLAKDRPEYKDRKYDDGHTPAEHYRAWNEYFVAYCLERARKSLCIEMQSKYNSSMLRPLFSFYDFGEPRVKQAAGMFFDLYWAYWAQEQIDGHVSGGGSRNKKYLAFVRQTDWGPQWFYFGIGAPPEKIHGHHVNPMLTTYRPPAVVADIALDIQGRGRYEIRQRAQGLGKSIPGWLYKMRTDGGGLLRYSYCDPAFIIGTAMTLARPTSQWAAISTQSRCHGAALAGPEVARIVPAIRPKDNGVCFNAHWSVQSKGSLISQKLKYHRGAAESVVWLSKQGLGEPVEEDGVIFAEAQGAYAAVRVTRGGYTFGDQAPYAQKWRGFLPPEEGWLVVAKDDYAPVIVEIMAKTDIDSFDAFKAKVKACKIGFNGPLLEYTTIYGDVLTLDTRCENLPTINGQPIDFKPKKVFDSPFLTADYDSGVVTIQKGERKRVLDFNEPLQADPS